VEASELAELNRRICVMIAFRDGRPIEAISKEYENDNWQQTKYPSWNWLKADFRIAPEPRKPRECWAIMPEGNAEYVRVIATQHRSLADSCTVQQGDEIVHMREVLPGDVVPITPTRDAVVIQFIDGKRVISIECANSEALPHLEREAQMILHS